MMMMSMKIIKKKCKVYYNSTKTQSAGYFLLLPLLRLYSKPLASSLPSFFLIISSQDKKIFFAVVVVAVAVVVPVG